MNFEAIACAVTKRLISSQAERAQTLLFAWSCLETRRLAASLSYDIFVVFTDEETSHVCRFVDNLKFHNPLDSIYFEGFLNYFLWLKNPLHHHAHSYLTSFPTSHYNTYLAAVQQYFPLHNPVRPSGRPATQA